MHINYMNLFKQNIKNIEITKNKNRDREMSDNHIIDLFLNPQSVAVIGASKNPMKGGFRIVYNLVTNRFKGKIFPVNPNSDGEILGLKFKKSVLEIEDPQLGKVLIPGIIPKLKNFPGSIKFLGPELGEYNQEIYGEFLGLSEEEIKNLEENEVI